jgi:hypothetical protein
LTEETKSGEQRACSLRPRCIWGNLNRKPIYYLLLSSDISYPATALCKFISASLVLVNLSALNNLQNTYSVAYKPKSSLILSNFLATFTDSCYCLEADSETNGEIICSGCVFVVTSKKVGEAECKSKYSFTKNIFSM